MSRARDLADLAGSASAGGITGRNMVINGGMTISQRGTSFSSVANVSYTLDRMQWYDTGAGVVDISQSTDTPNGNFYNSLKIDVTTADASLAAGDLYNIIHQIEGYNIAHLGWGTSVAKTVTLSFHIKSPKTGTHSIALRNSDQSRTRVEEFTVSAADTWEKKTITIPGDTSGTWQATTSAGIQLIFPLAAGSTFHAASTVGSWGTDSNNSGNIYASSNQVNCMDDAANNWYITGIQLEVGSSATTFENEDRSTTLRKCQRYYQKTFPYGTAPAQNAGTGGSIVAVASGTGTAPNRALSYHWAFPVVMRTTPTTTTFNTSATNANWYNMPTGGSVAANILYASHSRINITNNAATTDNYGYRIQAQVDAEF